MKKAIVAMSGGVDSSVVAFLLKKKGYDVEGVFMDFGLDNGGPEKVKEVCEKLGIKHHIIDLKEKFTNTVIKYFLDSYEKGITPNPCILCNREIKFGELFKVAEDLEADYFATGHYVKLKKKLFSKEITVHRGHDRLKDQTYFLYNLNQEKLKKILFPLGRFQKVNTKKISKKNNLPNFTFESQDICFLSGDHNIFLKEHLDLKPGSIKTLEGEKVGTHKGLPLYTIGQRKGIEIGGVGPFYVVRIDYKENTLYVAREWNDKVLYREELIANEVNWISGKEPKDNFKCEAVIRYGHKQVPCKIKKNKDGSSTVKFRNKQRAVTPGQSIGFYKGDRLLGGGVIK